MSDQTKQATEQEKNEKQTSTLLMALGEELFPVLNGLDLNARAAAVECLYKHANMPPEVALSLLISPLEVGETIKSDPMLSMLMVIAQVSALGRLGADADLSAELEEILKNTK